MKKRYKSVIDKRIKESLKIIGIYCLVLTFFYSFVWMSSTNAGFLDEEKSENNIFSISTLSFSIPAVADFSPKISPSMETLKTISVVKEGSADFQYRFSVNNVSGDVAFCDALEIKDDLDDTFQSLTSYVSSNVDNLTKTDWNLVVGLTENGEEFSDKVCNFDLKIEAWQTGFVYGSGGFVDVETISNKVESDNWTNIADHLVINEVYYDVANDKGEEGDNEWVEIYNPTASAVNIKDWEICDNGSCDILASADLEIPANGYLVVTDKVSTWNEWTVPGNAVRIVLDNNIGNGLANNGDSLILKDDDGIEIDGMSYGTYLTQLNPACLDVLEGHSLARKPAGQDIDVADDFEDLASPNPGTNPHTIVMNEIMPNPVGDDDAVLPGGEWVELYNYGEYSIDLKDWKLKDGDGDNLDIKNENTNTGSTVVAGGERIIVYRNGDGDFNLSNDGDEVQLIDEKDLIKDSHKFEETPEGKTIARFPDAVGPWIDPEGTPGEENKMGETEKEEQILLTFEKCFDKKDKLKKDQYEPICQPEYLEYLGILEELDDKKANLELVEALIEKKEKEQEMAEEAEAVLVVPLVKELDLLTGGEIDGIKEGSEEGEKETTIKNEPADVETMASQEEGEIIKDETNEKEGSEGVGASDSVELEEEIIKEPVFAETTLRQEENNEELVSSEEEEEAEGEEEIVGDQEKDESVKEEDGEEIEEIVEEEAIEDDDDETVEEDEEEAKKDKEESDII